MEKEFSFSEILTVTSGRYVCDDFGRAQELMSHVMGSDIFTHQIPRIAEPCKRMLIEQFPLFDSPEILFAVGKLILMLDTEEGKKNPQNLILGWLSPLITEHGDSFMVKPDESGAFYYENPVDEAADLFGAENVLVINAK